MDQTAHVSRRLFVVVFGAVLAGITIAGCQDKDSALLPVGGKVTFGKNPLTRGTVIFYPDADKGNKSKEEPRGEIDDQGNYQLSTATRKGVVRGWYKVAVTAAEQIDPNNPYFTKWLIPERYIDYRTSKLAIEVVENPAPGAYDIRLEPK